MASPQERCQVQTCELCQRNKGYEGKETPKPLTIPSGPWEDITYDFITKLPLSNGFDSILVVIDHFSKMAHFIPCHETSSAEEVVDLFIKNIWKLHGLPK